VEAIAAETYTGNAIAPVPTVKVGGTTLSEGTDYTVSYSNNINPGTATVNIAGAGNYAGSTGSATFIINSTAFAPTDKIQIILPGTGIAVYPGQTVTVDTAGLNLISGSTVTFEWKLDGRTVGTGDMYTLPPDAAGSVLTLTLTVSGYAGSLVSAPVAISAWPSQPVMRRVTLQAVEGVVTNPAPGFCFVPSGDDFAFTIVSVPAGQTATVTTGRATDRTDGVEITAHTGGAYSVVVREIREPLVITAGYAAPVDPESTANAAVTATRVWSSGGQLHIASPTSGTAQVYSLTGQLVKTIPYTAGKTASATLAKGMYIVRTTEGTWKVIN
jgi:hypothetical protein